MTAGISAPGSLADPARGIAAIGPNSDWLRILVIASGLCASVIFVVLGLRYELQLYADGSLFSYAVAVQDAWTFHWHNISGRLFVYLFCHVPAEAYVWLTGDARGGIGVYGLLFFGSQLLGLLATYAADRSRDRVIFSYACFSVACVCPLVFGFPTELWVSHAVFWPALAVCHYARGGVGGFAAIAAALAALVFSHEGAVIFAAVILCTLIPRGIKDPAFRRATGAFILVMALWIVVKAAFPPDDYISEVLFYNALNFVDLSSLICGLFLLLVCALGGYAVAFFLLRRHAPATAQVYAAALVAAGLAAWWVWFDRGLHSDTRYYLRTALLMTTPVLGALAAWQAADFNDRLIVPLVPRALAALVRTVMAQALGGGVLLVLLIHSVETAKFVAAWADYKTAVRGLAIGRASDPVLGDPRFVSAARLDASLDPLTWPSTTPFLSVLLAPDFAPQQLVVDPRANYFWISCETATANEAAARAIPAQSRMLIRVHACLHRP